MVTKKVTHGVPREKTELRKLVVLRAIKRMKGAAPREIWRSFVVSAYKDADGQDPETGTPAAWVSKVLSDLCKEGLVMTGDVKGKRLITARGQAYLDGDKRRVNYAMIL